MTPLPDDLGEVRPRGNAALTTGIDDAGQQAEGVGALSRTGAMADASSDHPMAQCAFGRVMPRSRICRVDYGEPSEFRGISDVWSISSRHSHSAFRKLRRLSAG